MKKLRQLKVESLLKREIATLILMEVKNPKVKFVTVTGVSLSHDLKIANVFVSVMGDDETKKKAIKGLKDTSKFLRHRIGENIDLRYNPEIKFELDNSIDEHARVDMLLQKIEDEKKAGEKQDE